jgi:hypothetical protein
MNSIVGDVVRSGGAALVALHELAPARGVLARTVRLVDGRIEVDTALDRSGRKAPISVVR